ncbi:hypothetical protein F5Y13DRAFT_159567 [Hypoxylon sp. FL1857]|nr:hypothetical protein F5Y13DRAFT_159567 [Hypoxylon sp. FL1857]
MNGITSKPGADYLARVESFHRLDKEREDMLKELIAKYQDLEERFEKKCKEYDNEVQTRSLYQAQANETNKKLIDIQHKAEVNSFVFAIIDGDGAVFRDDWIVKGEEGGAIAAHQLQLDIKQHLKDIYPDVNVETWKIVVQVVLNLDGLSRKLYHVNLAKSMSDMAAFARGFSRAQGLFSIVDVGKGKEQADFKVRETLRLMVYNLQCKHIIFGPCHDRGYIVELRPYRLETSTATRLSLLETTPASYEFQELGFRRVKFADVFRSEPLPDGPPSPSVTLLTPPPSASKTPNYASVASSWRNTDTPVKEFTNLAITPDSPARLSPLKYYLVNASGERIDEPLPQPDAISKQRFRDRSDMEGRQPCNRWHLTGLCEVPSCNYYHGERLSLGEQLVLRIRARGTFCAYKGSCRNVDCYWGHNCKYGNKCQRPTCVFSGTHDMDMIPAEKIFEDGSRVKVSS